MKIIVPEKKNDYWSSSIDIKSSNGEHTRGEPVWLDGDNSGCFLDEIFSALGKHSWVLGQFLLWWW